MTRTVADAAAVLAVLAGRDEHDATSLPNRVPDYLEEIDQGIQGARIGYDEDYAARGVQGETAAAVQRALRDLEELGGRVVRARMPTLRGQGGAWRTICSAEAAAAHARTFPTRADQYGTFFRSFLEAGREVTGVDYAKANLIRREISGQIRRVFQDIDLLVCPSVAYEPCLYNPADAYGGIDPEAETLAGVPYSCLAVSGRFTGPFNFCGYPTLSLPCGFSIDGLPLSLQLVGRPLSESLLCRAGHAYEEATPWHARHPPV